MVTPRRLGSGRYTSGPNSQKKVWSKEVCIMHRASLLLKSNTEIVVIESSL